MLSKSISQFNPANSKTFTYGDSGEFGATLVASKLELMQDLGKQAADLMIDADAMERLRTRVGLTDDIRFAATFVSVAECPAELGGAEFMKDAPDALGFCFSEGSEEGGQDSLEVFIAIDPSRFPHDPDQLTDEQIEVSLELNHYFITQLLLAVDESDIEDDDHEPTEEEIAHIEEKASDILEELLEAGSPMFAVIPQDLQGDEEDEE
jgi:hypothetical protein